MFIVAELVECGPEMLDGSGTILSPSYPESYPNNAYCTYEIGVPQGMVSVKTKTLKHCENVINSMFVWRIVEVGVLNLIIYSVINHRTTRHGEYTNDPGKYQDQSTEILRKYQ